MNRYAMLTVDTEALPRRAQCNHVSRLIWGAFDQGTAGIRELCSIGEEFCAKHVFFIDFCGAYSYLDEMQGVVAWLDREGQDIQLHAHPEVLPDTFWASNGLASKPALMDQYVEDARAEFVIRYFGKLISKATKKDVLAFRAGSFRWNACSIRALKKVGMPLSFNNSMRAFNAGQSVFGEPTNYPFFWSNGVIEVPLTETRVPPRPGGGQFWASLTYPESPYFPFQAERRSWLSTIFGGNPAFSVFLLHSWSLLNWDENGYATYQDDRRIENYRKLVARITKDYDVITTADFLDLYARGKIPVTRTVDIAKAELMAAAK